MPNLPYLILNAEGQHEVFYFDDKETVLPRVKRTAGFGWEWRQDALRVREVAGGDLDTVRAWLSTAWRLNAAKRTETLGMLEAWTELDQATVLLGTVDDVVRNVRLCRYRRGTTAAVAWIGPHYDEPEQLQLVEGLRAWLTAVGYTTVTSFVPAHNWDNARVRSYVDQVGMRVLGIRESPTGTFYETEWTV